MINYSCIGFQGICIVSFSHAKTKLSHVFNKT